MAVSVICQECDSRFKVKEELAGKLVRCSSCSQPIRVPGGRPPKPKTPKVEALEDWEESQDEWDDYEDAPITPRKKTNSSRKKKRSKSKLAGSALAWLSWLSRVSSVDVLSVMTWGLVATFVVVFLAGFSSPAMAQYFVVGNLFARALIILCCVITFFGVAGKENPACFMLCMFPLYTVWYAISRWDRCGDALSVLFLVMFVGAGLDYAAQAAYASAGVDWKIANTAVSWTFRR